MKFHDVDILCRVFWLDCFGAFAAAGAGFFVLVGVMHIALLSLLLNDFILFQRVPGAMYQACVFRTGRRITRMACIVSLALAIAALLRVGWQGGCSSPFPPSITDTVRFCLLSIFRRCLSFLNCLHYFHVLKHLVCLLAVSFFKTPSLYVGLFLPQVGDGVKENLVHFFRVHFLGGAWSREKRKVVIQFRWSCRKSLEYDILRFSHYASHCAFLFVECVDGK